MRTRTELVDDAAPDREPDEMWTVEVDEPPSRFPTLARFGLAAAGFMIFVIAAAFVMPMLMPASWTQASAERMIGQLVGVPVRVAGDHSFRLLPTLRLTANDIVQDTQDGADPRVRIKHLELEMSAFGAIAGAADVHRVLVDSPQFKLSLVHDEAGGGAAPSSIDHAWGWWRDMTISDVSLINGSVELAGAGGRPFLSLTDLAISGVDPGQGEAPDGLAFDGKAMLNGEAVTLRLSTSDPGLFVLGNRWPLKANLSSARMTGSFDGSLAMRASLVGDGSFRLSSDDAMALAAWLGIYLPARVGSNFLLRGDVGLTGNAVHLEKTDLQIGATQAVMQLTMRGIESGNLVIDGMVDATLFDFGGGHQDRADILAAADRSLNAVFMPPGRVEVKWQRALWRTYELGQGSAVVERTPGAPSISITAEDIEAYGGSLRGKLTLDASEGMRALSVDASLVGIELGPLAATTDMNLVSPMTGQSSITINLFSVGGDAEQLVEALSGRAEVVVADGVLTVPELTAELVSSARRGIPFKSVNANFTIGQGVASSDGLLLQSDEISLVGKGRIDLTDGNIDIDVGRLGGSEGASARSRFRVSGPAEAINVQAIN